MKSIKIMGLCLVAAFAVSAVAVATASATKPEFRFSGTKRAFSSKSGAGTLYASNGAEVKCTLDTDDGEIGGASGTDLVTNVLVSFTKCTLTLLGKTGECKTVGANKEEVRTNILEGQLGYIKKTAPVEVGLVLKPKSPNTVFATLECVNGSVTRTIEVKGEIVGKIAPINKLIAPGKGEGEEAFTLTYKVKGKTKPENTEQVPNALEVLGTPLTGLLLTSNENGGTFANAGLETTDEIFPLESVEISA